MKHLIFLISFLASSVWGATTDDIWGYDGSFWRDRSLVEAGISPDNHSHTHASTTGQTPSDHHTATVDTNAQTICTGATEVLLGDGSCTVPSGSGNVSTSGVIVDGEYPRWNSTLTDLTSVTPATMQTDLGYYPADGTIDTTGAFDFDKDMADFAAIRYETETVDNTTKALTINGQAAWAGASTNIDGGDIGIYAGIATNTAGAFGGDVNTRGGVASSGTPGVISFLSDVTTTGTIDGVDIAARDHTATVDTGPTVDCVSGNTLQESDGDCIATPTGGGDVTGPASSVDNRIATFDLTTGKIIQDSGSLISGIEASTANVTTAGALMDSEVDADIKTLTIAASSSISGSNTGDNAGVTAVTGGTGVSSSGGTTPDIDLTVDELAEKTGAVVATDRIVGTSGTTNFAETISGIPLSIFNDDLTHTTSLTVSDITDLDNDAATLTIAASTTISGSNTGDQNLADTVAEITDLDNDAATLTIGASATVNGSNTGDSQTLSVGVSDVTATAAELNVLDLAGLTDGFVYAADSATTASWQAQEGGTPEGTAVLSTGEVGGNKFLREDGDNSSSWNQVTDANLSTSDITTNDFSITKHGFVPKGTNVGSFLKDDGTWATPAGSGNVSTSGVPVANDYAQFVNGTDIRGRTFAEMKTDEGIMTDLTDDATPQLSATMDTNGFDIEFNAGFGIRGEVGNEIMMFQPGSSAVNYAQVFAGATGTGPQIGAAGDNTDIDFRIYAEGTGEVIVVASDLNVSAGSILVSGTVDGIDIAAEETRLANTSGTNTGDSQTLAAGVSDITASAAELNVFDLTGLTDGFVYAADSATTASWQAQEGGAGDMVLADAQTVTGAKTFDTATLLLNDTDSLFDLELASTSTITTANKTLTFDTNDANRTLTVSGDATVSGTNTGGNTGDQNLADTVAEITDLDNDAATLTIGATATVTGSNTGDSQTLSAGVSDVTATAAELNSSSDISGRTAGDVYSADTATTASWKAQSGGTTDLVTDLSPQLGAPLDTNTFDIAFDTLTGIDDENGNEQIVFSTTAAATNHVQVANSASGNPLISSVGDSAAIGLDLLAKGTGLVRVTDSFLVTGTSTLQGTVGVTGNITVTGTVDGVDIAARDHAAPTTLAASATDVTATAAELNVLDLAGLTDGFVYAADSATTASWQAQAGGTHTESSADTLTNKTFDANGTGNTLSNVDVADLANGTDGEIITWSATGVAATVAVGTATHVLTSNGIGVAPTFQAAPGAGSGTVMKVDTGSDLATADFQDGGDINFTDTAGVVTAAVKTGVLAVTDLANATDGELITWSTAGVATTVPVGTSTHVLTSNGTGTVPTFQVIPTQTITYTESFTVKAAELTDDLYVKAVGTITLVELNCMANGTGAPSAHIVQVVECTNAGATCANSGLTITAAANQTNYADTSPTDATIDDGDWWGLETDTFTTAAEYLNCTVEYTM